MTQETAKERLYSKLNEVKTNHDKALNVYGTQTMNEVLKIVDSYFENLSSTTDKLSVEKLQEIRVEELKDFNSKILQAELKNQKLQEEIDAAKKYIEESYKADKEDNKLLDLIIETVDKLQEQLNTAKKALTKIYTQPEDDEIISIDEYPSQIRYYAKQALSAIGNEGSGNE